MTIEYYKKISNYPQAFYLLPGMSNTKFP